MVVKGLNDEEAEKFAFGEGMNLLMSKYHATHWNGKTSMISPQPEFFGPKHAADLKSDLQSARGKGRLSDTVEAIEDQYRPVFDPQVVGQRTKEDGSTETVVGGWVLKDRTGQPLVLSDQNDVEPGQINSQQKLFIYQPSEGTRDKPDVFKPVGRETAKEAAAKKSAELDAKIENTFDFVLGGVPTRAKPKTVKGRATKLIADPDGGPFAKPVRVFRDTGERVK